MNLLPLCRALILRESLPRPEKKWESILKYSKTCKPCYYYLHRYNQSVVNLFPSTEYAIISLLSEIGQLLSTKFVFYPFNSICCFWVRCSLVLVGLLGMNLPPPIFLKTNMRLVHKEHRFNTWAFGRCDGPVSVTLLVWKCMEQWFSSVPYLHSPTPKFYE